MATKKAAKKTAKKHKHEQQKPVVGKKKMRFQKDDNE